MTQQEPEENETESGVDEIVEDIQVMAMAEEKEKAQNYLDNWKRTQADFENYKRRTEQEKIDLRKFANSALILNFLSVVDDMDRAFASIPPEIEEIGWVEGIKLIERKFIAKLESQGLLTIKALGETFDPNLHEAIRHEKGKEGEILEEVQKGYTFHDRVLRPTQVVVGNGEEE